MRKSVISASLGMLVVVVLGLAGCSDKGSASTNAENTGTKFSISGRLTLNGAALAEVPVTLTGRTYATTKTDVNGNFKFTGAQNGSYTVAPMQVGYIFEPKSQSIKINGKDSPRHNFNAKIILM